ncbi:MAG: NAD-dependent epimerase/dehydratase family protein [Caldilineaceae bacterium]
MSITQPLKVHITGVYGLIGNLAYQHLAAQPDKYDVYGSGRRVMSSARADADSITRLPDDHFVIADLADADAIDRALAGMDVVLHIAAVPDPSASFEDVLSSNIVGTYNVLEACRKHGIKRLVYASSIMTTWGYFKYVEPYRAIYEGRVGDIPAVIPKVKVTDPTHPTEPYSASKVWAEGFCRTYHDLHGISTVCLRIGGVNKADHSESILAKAVWCSQRDVCNIINLALDATAEPRFDICYGVSDNKHRWVDLEHSKAVLEFVPQDGD